MRHPPLKSLLNPTGPDWVAPFLPDDELTGIRHSLALLVGYDTQAGVVRVLGSGYIVHTDDTVYVVTATHVLMEFCKHALGPHIRTPLEDAEAWREKEKQRLGQVFAHGSIKVLVETVRSTEVIQLDVRHASFGTDEQGLDVAIVQCAYSDRTERLTDGRFTPLLLDLDPVTSSEVLFMAGFANLPTEIPLGEAERIGKLRSNRNIVVRGGYVREVTDKADGYHKGAVLMRANMPSEPGMSGGPLMRKREPRGRPGVFGGVFQWTYTAIGIVSRSRCGGMFEHFENRDGETWVVPISELAKLSVTFRGSRYAWGLLADFIVINYHDLQTYIEALPQLPEGRSRAETLNVDAVMRMKGEQALINLKGHMPPEVFAKFLAQLKNEPPLKP